MERAPSALWDAYRTLKSGTPMLRARDAARALAVTECELAAADPSSTWLRPDWNALLTSLAPLGTVMALVRNEACVHELTGNYANVTLAGQTGLALRPNLDLRLFLNHWCHAFATRTDTPRGPVRNLQFFDRHGEAVQKVYLRADSHADAFDALVERFRVPPTLLCIDLPPAAPAPSTGIDVDAFRTEWLSLRDIHQFHPFLRRWGLPRQQAFELAPPGHACRVDAGAAERLLNGAAADGVPIMVFVGNRGAIQIHTGQVHRIKRLGEWLNVFDPGFNLHLRTDLIADAWVVRKPGDCGPLGSLELLDANGDSIVTFFGERQPGHPARPEWTALLASLLPEDRACAG